MDALKDLPASSQADIEYDVSTRKENREATHLWEQRNALTHDSTKSRSLRIYVKVHMARSFYIQ